MSMEFPIHQANLEITSVDATSHGCYLLVGCGNGFILLYNLMQPSHEGLLVGHIHAKGLHTNLLMTLKITEDCRYCFAGVMRGSSEMLAIDLGRLPVWSSAGAKDAPKKSSRPLLDLITRHSFSDPKLRGFGAAARVMCTDDSSAAAPRYRLVCGRGIKNVHVWQFVPPSADFDALSGTGEAAQWTCIYDVASNGNTIESVGFRRGGAEVLSKSNGANLRVWDISQFEKDSGAKPVYEDAPNSNDVKTILDDFAFGGTYDFSVVSLRAPKNANRDSFELPERSTEDTNGQRKKRMMRQIEEVIGTSDAGHVLALCTDGGVLYFKNGGASGDDKGGTCALASLTEFSRLHRDPEVASVWALKRVGLLGDVLLMRASNGSSSNGSEAFTSIRVELLVDATGGEVAATSDSSWSKVGYYFDPSDPPLPPKQQALEAPPSKAEKTLAARPPLPPTVAKKAKSKPSAAPSGKENSRSAHNVPVPTVARQAVAKPPPSAVRTPHATGGSSSALHISPQDSLLRLVNQTGSAVKRERPVQQEPQWLVIEEEPPLPRQRAVLDRPLKRLKSAISCEVVKGAAAEPSPDRFAQLKDEWLRSMRVPVKRDPLHVRLTGVSGLQQLGQVYREQDRLRGQFASDVVRCLSAEVRMRAAPEAEGRGCAQGAPGLRRLVEQYREEAAQLVRRQALDLQGACALDDIFERRSGGSDAHCTESLYGCAPAPLPFKYEGMFAESIAFSQQLAAALWVDKEVDIV